MDKVLVLKNTKQGLSVDTVYNAHDTIIVQLKNETSVTIPDNTIKVELPPKSNLDIISSWAVIIGGLAGIIGAFIAFYQLFKSVKNKEDQIQELKNQTTQLADQTAEFAKQTQELIKQTNWSEKRLRMAVKPYLWSNIGGMVNGVLQMSIDNRGNICFYDGYEIIEGDNINFNKFNRSITIKKDESMMLSANYTEKPLKEIFFKLKIFYHDQEDFKYESIIEFKQGAVNLVETIDK